MTSIPATTHAPGQLRGAVHRRSERPRALVVMPHPDDADFGAGGTVASWTATGIEVTYCLVTDGGAGLVDVTDAQAVRGAGRGASPGPSAEPAVERPDAAGVRRREQERAAAALGVTEVRYLGYADGKVEASLALRCDLTRVIREVRPTRVLAPTPVWNLSSLPACHPDHLAVGAAVAFAVYPDATTPAAYPELLDAGLGPWQVRELWFMSDPLPNRAVDVTDTFEAKLGGVRAHETQLAASNLSTEAMRGWAAEAAARWRLGHGRLAEEFRVVAVP